MRRGAGDVGRVIGFDDSRRGLVSSPTFRPTGRGRVWGDGVLSVMSVTVIEVVFRLLLGGRGGELWDPTD